MNVFKEGQCKYKTTCKQYNTFFLYQKDDKTRKIKHAHTLILQSSYNTKNATWKIQHKKEKMLKSACNRIQVTRLGGGYDPRGGDR